MLLTGHMDVVPADPDDWTGHPYELERDGDRIVGRGTSDMKAALAAKLLAAESYLAENDPDDIDGEVILAFVTDEEWGGAGTQALVDRGIEADCAIIGEPSRLQTCVAQKGVVRYRFTVRGRSSHSGTPHEGVNAIDGLRRVMDAIEQFGRTRHRETSHELLAPETVTITEIEGGSAPNVVPDRAACTADWRFLPGEGDDPGPFDERVEAAIDGVTLDGEPVDVTVERLILAGGAEIDAGHALVRTVQAAAEDAGVSSQPVGFNAATDARFLVQDAGIPTVLFGPGSIEDDAHTVDESIAVDDLVATAHTYRNVLDRLL